MSISTINYLTDIHFGVGAAARLSDLLSSLDVSRPLLVTDKGLLDLGIESTLGLNNAAVFANVPGNPSESSVLEGVTVYREQECDGIVAAGGGSPMDCAKSIALLTTHPAPLGQYALIHGGIERITGNKPPLIAVPTTAGTGSEVGRASLITFNDGQKLAIISRHMIPDVAVCDPELTRQMPAKLTAATGMDAISHCVETFCSPKFNPVADAIALDGLYRGWTSIRGVMDQPDDLSLRSEMMMAALQGALAFQKGLGLIHSLSHPMGALERHSLHHGTLNAIFLPHVLRFNAASCETAMQRMAGMIGCKGGAEQLARASETLIRDLELPLRLRDLGVTHEDLETIPPAALADHSTPSNPRTVTEEDCRRILDEAY